MAKNKQPYHSTVSLCGALFVCVVISLVSQVKIKGSRSNYTNHWIDNNLLKAIIFGMKHRDNFLLSYLPRLNF